MPLGRKQVTYSARPTHAARAAHAKGEKQFRTYDTSAIKPHRNHKGPIIFGIVLAVVAAVLLAVFIPRCTGGVTAEPAVEVIPAGENVTFTVPEGATSAQIAQTLVDAHLVGTVTEFNDAVAAANAETSLKPGTYTLEGGQTAADLVDLLVAGPVATTFTVPEGLTVARTAAVVAQAYNGTITEEDFVAAASNAAAYVADFPFVEGAYNNSLEGFLFPKTYDMADDDTADTVIRKMLSQYALEVASLDYAFAADRGLGPYDVLKLASIIEREADDATAGLVSSVFYNRIAMGMRLQSDATVAYVIGGDPTPDDLKIESPYNTYLNDGLPAGPICSPGLACLQAACAPTGSEYLFFYFVPREDGSGTDYFFSENEEQHNAAIAGEREPTVPAA